MVSHRHRLSREAVSASSLDVFNTRLDEALSNLKMSLFTAGMLEGAFNPNYSMICRKNFCEKSKVITSFKVTSQVHRQKQKMKKLALLPPILAEINSSLDRLSSEA